MCLLADGAGFIALELFGQFVRLGNSFVSRVGLVLKVIGLGDVELICRIFSATTDWQKYNTRFSNYCFKFFGD